MSQQINLFNPLFLKQKKYFSALMMLQSTVVLMVGLAVFQGYAMQQEALLERQVAATVRETASQIERLGRVSAEFSPGDAQKQAEAELSETSAAVAARESLLRQMQSGTRSTGYSEYLRAFARQVVNGVWLTGVDIEEGARNLTLKGNALQAELIPAFISRLGAEAVLRGASFESLSISQAGTVTEGKSPGALAYVAFRLSSTDLPHEPVAENEPQGGGR